MSLPSSAKRTEGTITWTREFEGSTETYETWYYTIGDISPASASESSSSTVPPIIILHGGPAIPSQYMSPHELLHSSTTARPVIFYDQIGGGKSTHFKDRGAEFWTVDLFIDELETVLKHFGLSGPGGKPFDVLGHSWGGMLAADWASVPKGTGGPGLQNLRKLVLTDAPASMALWEVATNGLLESHPELAARLRELEREGKTESPEYGEKMMQFYQMHICTVVPWPQALQDGFAKMQEDPVVYLTMCGPSEFNITGSLKPWGVVDRLSNITVPTLVMNGKDDEAQDVAVLPYVEGIKGAKWVKFEKSSHMPFFEETEHYIDVVTKFLDEN